MPINLKPYIKLVKFLGEVLGPHYEIVLQDISNTSHAIIAIANGHISGREVGAPLTDWSLKMLRDKEYEKCDYKVSYNGLSKDNKLMRSSTFFIKENNELIGMLCINFDSSKYLELSKQILCLCHPDALVEENYNFTATTPLLNVTENLTSSVSELTDAVLSSSFLDENIAPNRLTKEEKLSIVNILNNKGVFQVKGAVCQVANKLCCSEASIYRYLNKMNKETK